MEMIWFWVKAIFYILCKTATRCDWHMILVDIHDGDDEEGNPMRKRLIARRTVHGAQVEWQ